MRTIAVIIAGGSGHRMGQDIPKQFINEDFTFATDIFRISDIGYVTRLCCFSLYGYWYSNDN